jgi:hypothetical protein
MDAKCGRDTTNQDTVISQAVNRVVVRVVLVFNFRAAPPFF